jgi:hypothetical protein
MTNSDGYTQYQRSGLFAMISRVAQKYKSDYRQSKGLRLHILDQRLLGQETKMHESFMHNACSIKISVLPNIRLEAPIPFYKPVGTI